MADDTHLTTPVLIVGGGPVGLALALFLDYWNVQCTILNTSEHARMMPKGNGQNARTMEHWRQLGLSDEIRKLGLPNDHPFDQAFFTRFNAWQIFRSRAPSWEERRKLREKSAMDDQFPEPMYHVNQMYVEQFLLEKVEEKEGIDVRFGWEAKAFEQDGEGVTVHAEQTNGSGKASWRASYMVDCSGGRSFIRRALGIKYEGDVHEAGAALWTGQFYNVWLRIPDLYDKFLGHRKAWMYWAVNKDPDTRGMLVSLNGKDEFLVFSKPRSPTAGVDEGQIKGWLKQSIGADIPIEVLGYAPWTAGAALVAEKFQAGRIFLAGDSASLFTPVGAFGMNTGIDAAHNLAWKLSAVLHGWGGPKLLDTYELERKPIGIKNTGASRKFSSKWHDPEIPDAIEEDSPAGEEARRKAPRIGYIANNHFILPEELDCAGVQLGARYDGSPLIIPDGVPPEDRFPETYSQYSPSGVPGGRAPHIWLGNDRNMGSSLFDRLGKGFNLLRICCPDADVSRLQVAADERSIPLQVLDVDVSEAIALYERKLVLLRPDRYIAWRGDDLPADCEGLLNVVCGFDSHV